MDLNVQAFRLVEQATSERPSTERAKKKAAQKGGLAGGRARARVLSAEQRMAISKKANDARWAAKGNTAE